MVKSAMSEIVKESAKLDLSSWLAGGKPRTKTVSISNQPNLAAELDELAEQMDALFDKIEAAKGESSGSIVDDVAADLEVEWDSLKEQYDVLLAEHQESLMPFTFRGQKPADLDEVKAMLKTSKLPASNENIGLGLVAHLCVEPVMTIEELRDALEVLGSTAFLQMNDVIVELARKRKEPTAPLSQRP